MAIRSLLSALLFAATSVVAAQDTLMEQWIDEAEAWMQRSRPDSAMPLIEAGLRRVEHTNVEDDRYFLLCFRAEMLYYQGLFEEGMNDAVRSLDIAQGMGDSLLIANGYNLIGLLFENVDDPHEALPFLRNARHWFPTNGSARHPVSELYQIHGNLGQTYAALDMADSARYHLEASLVHARRKKAPRGISIAQWGLGQLELSGGRTESARMLFSASMQLAVQDTIPDMVVENLAELAKAWRLSGNTAEALAMIDRGRNYVGSESARIPEVTKREFFRKAAAELELLQRPQEALRMQRTWYALDSAIQAGNTRSALRTMKAFDASNQRLELEKLRSEQYAVQLAQEKRIRSLSIIIGVLLLIGAGVYFRTYLARQRQHRRLAELEVQRMQQEAVIADLRIREQVGRDMHDDLGAGLSALKLRSEMALRGEKDPAQRAQLRSLADTAGELIGNMRRIIWTMNADQGSLEDLVVYVSNYARTYLDQHELRPDISAEGPWPSLQLTSEERRNILLTVKEALHNVVKHAQASTVRLVLQWNAGLAIEITDDGIGIPPGADHGTGNGLRNMQRRIAACGGSSTLERNAAGGTTLHFMAPFTPNERSIAPEEAVRSSSMP